MENHETQKTSFVKQLSEEVNNDQNFAKENHAQEDTEAKIENYKATHQGMPVDWYLQNKVFLEGFGYKIECSDFQKDLNTLFGDNWGWIPAGKYTFPAAGKDKTQWIVDQGVVEEKEIENLVVFLAGEVNEKLAKWLLEMHDAEMEDRSIILYRQICEPCKGFECLGSVRLNIVQSIAQHKLVFVR